MKRLIISIVSIALLLSTQHLYADTLRLKNGNVIEGIIVEQGDQTVTVKLDIGTMTFDLSEIESINESSLDERKTLEKQWELEKAEMATLQAEQPEKRERPQKKRRPLRSKKIKWVHKYDKGMASAGRQKKVAMVDLYTDWCGWCKKLDDHTYKDKDVLALAENFVCIKVDADKNKPLVKKYNVTGYPTILFLKPNGDEVGRIRGYLPPKQFAQKMKAFVR